MKLRKRELVMRRAFTLPKQHDSRGDMPSRILEGWGISYCGRYMSYTGPDQCEFYQAIGKTLCQDCSLPKREVRR